MELADLQFKELAELRLFLHDLRSRHVASLSDYFDADISGFQHRHDVKKPRISIASTATCVVSLVAAGYWRTEPWKDAAGRDSVDPWKDSASRVAAGLLSAEWRSAGLRPGNLFSVSFVVEAVTALRSISNFELSNDLEAKLSEATEILRQAAAAGPPALNVLEYPTSAYIAQLVIRTLQKQPEGFAEANRSVSEWAEHEINRQITLLTRNDKTADVFSLAYAAILLANLVEPSSITPDQDFLVDSALEVLFERQRTDGTWPLSRPLFHYPAIGSAHCYDYEMLVQLLAEPRLRDKLLKFIPQLARSAYALRSYFPLGKKVPPVGKGWSSGHHPQVRGPESWSTASVYHFAYVLERLIAERIRIETFSYLGAPYIPPQRPDAYSEKLDDDFLDCSIRLDNTDKSLKTVVSDVILTPLVASEIAGDVEAGRPLPDGAPVSILLFGPPGTSKTDLAKRIAKSLGWPLLAIDASQFLRDGMDGVYAEADQIFGMLAAAERVLVLLDEFDEMVRAREKSPDILSRFLTTAMLPKLIKINDNRRLVFVVATNHIDWFDVAIRRPGRFDVILQVMPPTAIEKLRKWPKLGTPTDFGITDEEFHKKLEPLTFLETKILGRRLAESNNTEQRVNRLNEAHARCTLLSDAQATASEVSAGDPETDADTKGAQTWQALCAIQSSYSRVP
jgi:hypothetical protein